MVQIHKTFTDEQAKELMQRYVNQQVDRKHLQGLLGIKERRFFDLLKKYKEDPQNFTIQYHRNSNPKIPQATEKNIIKELKTEQKTIHEREVLTHYIGELIQHDSSCHLWSPAAQEKWHLITSLDDFSRYILYGALLKKETSWVHISALQFGNPQIRLSLYLLRGFPFYLPLCSKPGFPLA